MEYDPDHPGQVRFVLNAAGRTNAVSYYEDATGRLLSNTVHGVTTQFAYDALGRLTARTGAGSVPVYYAHDALGRMTTLTDGEGNVTAFAYDAQGRLVRKTYADGSFYTYGYDAHGRLTNRTDAAGVATGYRHDPAGRRIRREDADGTAIDYAYDDYDQLTNAVYAKPHDPARAAALRFGYRYDEIRLRLAYGGHVGNRLREDRGQTVIEGVYNPLNQLRERRLSGKVDVYGTTDAGTVRVGGAAATIFAQATVTNYWGGHPMRPGALGSGL